MSYFRWQGGAVRLIDKVEDPFTRRQEWGHLEKDEYTMPFGPGSLMQEEWEEPAVTAGPWVWRYGVASAGTGAKYEALVTKIHADVASRLGGPIVVTLLSPWQVAYPFADEGYLDESYVLEKLFQSRNRTVHSDDLAAITRLVRILLGRTQT